MYLSKEFKALACMIVTSSSGTICAFYSAHDVGQARLQDSRGNNGRLLFFKEKHGH